MNFDKLKLNALIAEKGLTKVKLSKLLNMNTVTLHRKIERNGNFSKDEILNMCEIFGKDKVLSIFFGN